MKATGPIHPRAKRFRRLSIEIYTELEKQLSETLRYGTKVLLVALGLCWAGTPTRAQSPASPTGAGPLVGTAGGAVSGTLVPTNMPGVYAFTQPPTGFDPNTATAGALADYGYPPRPAASAGAEALSQWQAATRPTLQRVVPALAPTGIYHGPVSELRLNPKNGAEYSYNWSGYALTHNAAAVGFYSVIGHWTVPTAQQRFGGCSGYWDYSAQWVGLDGYNSSDVLQSGSEADAYCDVGQQVTQYYPWFEWYPAPSFAIYQSTTPRKLYPFYPGDYLMVHVWATHWANGSSQTGRLLFTDLTQNWQASMLFRAPTVAGRKVKTVGRSAEWVVERPSLRGTLLTLANYTANPWAHLYATDLNQFVYTPAAPGAAYPHRITMVDNAGGPISRVTMDGNYTLWFYNEGTSR
jgi:Peptidase A4 family